MALGHLQVRSMIDRLQQGTWGGNAVGRKGGLRFFYTQWASRRISDNVLSLWKCCAICPDGPWNGQGPIQGPIQGPGNPGCRPGTGQKVGEKSRRGRCSKPAVFRTIDFAPKRVITSRPWVTSQLKEVLVKGSNRLFGLIGITLASNKRPKC